MKAVLYAWLFIFENHLSVIFGKNTIKEKILAIFQGDTEVMVTMTYKAPDFLNITDGDIIRLIECPKEIIKHAKRYMIIENGSERNDMELVSMDEIYEEQQSFSVFLRRSCVFPEDFSVGLIWKPKDAKRVILLRYNGKHGMNRSVAHQRVPHVHRLLAEDMLNQNYDPHHAEMTKEYVTMEGAIPLFMQKCHVTEWEKDFPWLLERNLFDPCDWSE